MPVLTIVIPTYNRHEFLRDTLQALRPQAREDVELVIVDNCSTPPVEALVQEGLAGSSWSFRVVRNAVNVGLCANLLRCFEVAQGDWLWPLSDDDTVKPDAVSIVLQTLDHHPDLLFALYSLTVLPIEKEVICETVDAFFLALHSLPQVMFISTTVYQRRELTRHLFLAYNFVDTGAPHTALLLLEGLSGEKRKLAYLPQELVSWQSPPAEQRYSQFAFIGMHKLLGLCHGRVREHLAAVMRKDVSPPLCLVAHLVRDAATGRDRDLLHAILAEYFDAYGKLRGGIAGAFWRRPARLAGHIALRFAGATKAIAEFSFRVLRGKPFFYDPNPVSLNSYLRLSETTGEKSTLP